MGDKARMWTTVIPFALVLMAALAACAGGDDSSDGSALNGPTTTSAAVESSADPEAEEASDSGPTVPQLAEAECAALTEFMERGAPSPIDGSVSVDLATLPDAAQPAAEVFTGSAE